MINLLIIGISQGGVIQLGYDRGHRDYTISYVHINYIFKIKRT